MNLLGLTFEPTISLGAIVQTIVLLAGIIAWGSRLNTEITLMKREIDFLEATSKQNTASLTQLTNTLTAVAVQDNRIDNLERRVDDLAHNRGFITN